MKSALHGLKAVACTTEERPPLRILFLPRFWGSQETRWERGKTHLVPSVLRGWDDSDFTLCGIRYGESEHGEEVKPGDPIPTRVCKKCQQVAKRRGYGQ